MLSLYDGTYHRREWLRLGAIGSGGLMLSNLLRAAPKTSKTKSVIFICLLGGPPQHETWDPKPDAPAEIRGPFGTIPSSLAGLRVGELMPKTAKIAHKLAILRAVSTGDNAHSSSGYQVLTGVPHVPLNVENVTAKAPNHWPSLAALVRHLVPDRGGLPSSVILPENIWNDGNIPWPGQDAGFLGLKAQPWFIHCDPNDANFRIPDLALSDDISLDRFQGRKSLLDSLAKSLDRKEVQDALAKKDQHTRKAFELLGSGAARQAFDLSKESPATRDRYGRTRFGQSCLLARRLIEAGVSLVQVNWTRIKGALEQGMWDTHSNHGRACKEVLMPIMDQAFPALIEDLEQRGLLNETLVVWGGEFGRTPKINTRGGRDHWGHVFSMAFAGGGIKAGTVYGTSDKNAGYPIDGKVTPADVYSTVFHLLGISPNTEIHDPQGRPTPISRGDIIKTIV